MSRHYLGRCEVWPSRSTLFLFNWTFDIVVTWQTVADFVCYGACDDFAIEEVHFHGTLSCLIQVISDTIIYEGLVAPQLSLIMLGILILPLPIIFCCV